MELDFREVQRQITLKGRNKLNFLRLFLCTFNFSA